MTPDGVACGAVGLVIGVVLGKLLSSSVHIETFINPQSIPTATEVEKKPPDDEFKNLLEPEISYE